MHGFQMTRIFCSVLCSISGWYVRVIYEEKQILALWQSTAAAWCDFNLGMTKDCPKVTLTHFGQISVKTGIRSSYFVVMAIKVMLMWHLSQVKSNIGLVSFFHWKKAANSFGINFPKSASKKIFVCLFLFIAMMIFWSQSFATLSYNQLVYTSDKVCCMNVENHTQG